MRTVSGTFQTLQAAAQRKIGGRVVFRDTRLQFTSREVTETTNCALLYDHDCSVSGSGWLRVSHNTDHELDFVFWDDPTEEFIPPFTPQSGVVLEPNSGVGINDGRVWFVSGSGASNGYICYADWNGTDFDTPVQVYDAMGEFATGLISLAPVADDVCYVQVGPLSSPLDHSRLYKLTSAGVLTEFHGYVYGDPSARKRFDAVRLGSIDYVFVVDRDSGRALYCSVQSGVWSDLEQVIPLDVVDNESSFSLGGVEVIDDKIFVSGRLVRGLIEMDMYIMGDGDHFSMARDLFITHDFATDIAGKMLYVSGSAIFQGYGGLAYSQATSLVGYTNADKETSTDKVYSIATQSSPNSPAQLSLDVSRNLSTANMRPSGEVDVYARLYSGSSPTECLIGTFGIDVISDGDDPQGKTCQVGARGIGMRRIDQWTSDQSYDYWSQTRSFDPTPWELSKLVRVSGNWTSGSAACTSGSTAMKQELLNVDSYMYSVEKAVRGGEIRAKFVVPDTDGFAGRYGVGLNYYRESRYEAATRLGIDSEEVTDSQYGNYGLFAIVEDGVVQIYQVVQSIEYAIGGSAALTVNQDEYHWIQMIFQDGYIRVCERQDSSTDWVEVLETRFDGDDEPWFREDRGRGALYVKNVTINSETPGFGSELDIIPVESTASFPTSETVIVDSEQITYNGKATYSPLPDEWISTTGQSWSKATHDNALWTEGLIKTIMWDPEHAGEHIVGADLNDCMYVGQAFRGPYGHDRVDKIKVVAKKVGSPSTLYCYFVLDPFDDTGPPWYMTYVVMTASLAGSSVGTSYGWVEFDFSGVSEATRWMNENYGKAYWIIITNVPPGTNPTGYQDGSNYFVVKLDTTCEGSLGIFLKWGDSLDWTRYTTEHPTDAIMPFEVRGLTNAGLGYPIFISGSQPALARTVYNDMALIVTSSDGLQTAFKITDFDHQAPDEWVPNQSYIEPDTWEDHVGQPGHGDWVTPDKARIFVETDPSGIISDGCTLQVMPALQVTARGANDTEASAHGATTVSVYRDASVYIDEVHWYSVDRDMRVCDMLQEISVKAGTLDFSTAHDLETSYEFPVGTTNRLAAAHTNAIIKMDIPVLGSGDSVGGIFRASGSSPTSAYAVTLDSDDWLIFSTLSGSSWTVLERYPVPFTPGGTMTISAQVENFSVWIANRFVHTFVDDEYTEGEYAGPRVIASGDPITLSYELAALDRRVDNFILDMGSRGTQLMSGVIGPKRISVRDTAEGGVYADRLKVVGPADYDLNNQAVMVAKTRSDTDIRTLVRVEGMEVVEEVDYDLLASDGFLFNMSDAPEANSEWETRQEALAVLADLRASRESYSVLSPLDLRVESNDVVDLTYNGSPITVIVGSVSFEIATDENDAAFDMNLECYGAGD